MSNKRKNTESCVDEITTSLNNVSFSSAKTTCNNAVLYTRVSSQSQTYSLHVQTQVLQNYCKDNKLKILDSYQDIGSAYNDSYKLSINSIIDMYNNINLIIKDPSRIARNIIDGAEIIKKCAKNNIIIHIVEHKYICNTNVAAKQLLCGIFDAQTEAETLSERVRSHNKVKKSMGAYFGSVPFGKESYSMMVDNVMIRKVRILSTEHKESKIINMIDMMLYGTTRKEFYKLFNSLHDFQDKLGGPKNKFTNYKGVEYTDLDFSKGFPISSIVGLLNDWKITKRGKVWTDSSVKTVMDSLPDFYPNKYEQVQKVTKPVVKLSHNMYSKYYESDSCSDD